LGPVSDQSPLSLSFCILKDRPLVVSTTGLDPSALDGPGVSGLRSGVESAWKSSKLLHSPFYKIKLIFLKQVHCLLFNLSIMKTTRKMKSQEGAIQQFIIETSLPLVLSICMR
jgi:hypothetical protein